MSSSICSNIVSSDSNFRRCAACKYLRRRCSQDCILSPYFPASNPLRFDCVHKIFGASNIARMLKDLPTHVRADAADSISLEAYRRVQDPVYGSAGIITGLQRKIYEVQLELAQTQAQLAMYTAQTNQAGPNESQALQMSQLAMMDGSFDDPSHLPEFF